VIELAERAARAAGEIIRRGWAQDVRRKGVVDLVTEVDLAAEARIREVLGEGAPGIPILGEEEGGAEGSATRWIVDPLDGTVNFVHRFPAFCVCIALQDRGDLEVGVVYDPVHDRCFRAVRGRGANRDGERLRVSETRDLGEALLASGFPYDRRVNAAYYLRFLQAFLERAQGFRRPGSAGLDLVTLASGPLDGFWEFGLKAWDVAAGTLIIREAGGTVTDMDGSPLDLDRPRVLASNGHLHDAMLAVVADLL